MSVDFTTAFASIGSSEPWCGIEEEEIVRPVTNARRILEQLQSIEEVGQVAIGVNSFFTLSAAAVRKNIEYVVIVDAPIREQQFWKMAAPVIASASDRYSAIIDLQCRLGDSKLLEVETENMESWLCDDARFARIQTIFQKNHFVCLDNTLRDAPRCATIKEVLNAHNLTIDFLHLSSSINAVAKERIGEYGASVEALLDSDTIIIDVEDEHFYTILPEAKCVSRLEELVQSWREEPVRERVRQRKGRSVEELFPLIGVYRGLEAQRVTRMELRQMRDISGYYLMRWLVPCTYNCAREVFYHYGMHQGYYTENEAQNIEAEVAIRDLRGERINREDYKLAWVRVRLPLILLTTWRQTGAI